jgi:hypothetical protein
VGQAIDLDIPENETARLVLELFFCFAVDAKFRHRRRYAPLDLQIHEFEESLAKLQFPGRIRNDTEGEKVAELQSSINQNKRAIRMYWRSDILKNLSAEFKTLREKENLALELGDIPIRYPHHFGRAVQPTRQGFMLDLDDPDVEGNDWPSDDDGVSFSDDNKGHIKRKWTTSSQLVMMKWPL